MSLSLYLRKPENLVSRERLIFHRLAFDLKLESAKVGHSLNISTPEVDRDGYDLVIWANGESTHVQCKSYFRTPSASWNIHKTIICPSATYFPRIQHNGIAYPHFGYNGSLIVTEITIDDDEQIRLQYHYTDLLIIWMFAKNLIRKKRLSPTSAENFLSQLLNDESRISIPNQLTIKPKSVAHLLALMGLESTVSHVAKSNLRNLMINSNGYPISSTQFDLTTQTDINWLRGCTENVQ